MRRVTCSSRPPVAHHAVAGSPPPGFVAGSGRGTDDGYERLALAYWGHGWHPAIAFVEAAKEIRRRRLAAGDDVEERPVRRPVVAPSPDVPAKPVELPKPDEESAA